MNRRRFLGAVGAVVLAGCNGLDLGGDDDGDPGVASGAGRYGDPHADHEWPTGPDPETAPAFDGEWPPGVDADGMYDPEAFLRFHDVRVSRSPYVVATLEDRRVEHGPDGTTETTTVTEHVAADLEAGRYYVETSRGSEHYGVDGVHFFRDVDGVVHASADRAHVTRRAVGGSLPYLHLTFRWTDATRAGDGSFRLSSDRPTGDGLPEVFLEEWRGVPQTGSLSLGPGGGITGWTLESRRRFRRDGDRYTVRWTSANEVRYVDGRAPDGLPAERPGWATDG